MKEKKNIETELCFLRYVILVYRILLYFRKVDMGNKQPHQELCDAALLLKTLHKMFDDVRLPATYHHTKIDRAIRHTYFHFTHVTHQSSLCLSINTFLRLSYNMAKYRTNNTFVIYSYVYCCVICGEKVGGVLVARLCVDVL